MEQCKTRFVSTGWASTCFPFPAQVVANAVCALQEIFDKEAESGSGPNVSGKEWILSKEVIYTLLNRIRDFSEWAQCIILALAAEYVPQEPVSLFSFPAQIPLFLLRGVGSFGLWVSRLGRMRSRLDSLAVFVRSARRARFW